MVKESLGNRRSPALSVKLYGSWDKFRVSIPLECPKDLSKWNPKGGVSGVGANVSGKENSSGNEAGSKRSPKVAPKIGEWVVSECSCINWWIVLSHKEDIYFQSDGYYRKLILVVFVLYAFLTLCTSLCFCVSVCHELRVQNILLVLVCFGPQNLWLCYTSSTPLCIIHLFVLFRSPNLFSFLFPCALGVPFSVSIRLPTNDGKSQTPSRYFIRFRVGRMWQISPILPRSKSKDGVCNVIEVPAKGTRVFGVVFLRSTILIELLLFQSSSFVLWRWRERASFVKSAEAMEHCGDLFPSWSETLTEIVTTSKGIFAVTHGQKVALLVLHINSAILCTSKLHALMPWCMVTVEFVANTIKQGFRWFFGP